MRNSLAVTFGAIALVSAIASAQAPASQTAGERYSSVKVLREIPSSMVIPTMAFIANSLGVTCLHCHTNEYASDEKPNKDKARAMMRMQRAINDQYFAGRQVVTCQTCHDGRAVPAATPDIANAAWNRPGAGAVADRSALPEAKAVLDQNAAAMGGQAAFDRLTNRLVTGTITRNSGRVAPESGPFELYLAKPTTATLTTPLSHPPEGDVELKASFAKPMLLRSVYKDVSTVGRERLRDRDVVVISGTASNGAVHRLLFDEATNLLLRRSDELATPLGNLPQHYDFDDYRPVDGVMVPFKVQWSRADYQITFVCADVKHNVPR